MVVAAAGWKKYGEPDGIDSDGGDDARTLGMAEAATAVENAVSHA